MYMTNALHSQSTHFAVLCFLALILYANTETNPACNKTWRMNRTVTLKPCVLRASHF